MSAVNEFILMDVKKERASELQAVLKQIEPQAKISIYGNLIEYQADVKARGNLKAVRGAFLRYDGNLKEITFLIGHLFKINPNIYVLVSADAVSIEVLKDLIKFGVSQVLTPPLTVESLKAKMKFAEEFQKKIVAENRSMPDYRPFSCNQQVDGNGNSVLYIVGWLADRCDLPAVKPNKGLSALILDFDLMAGISSIGVRSWLIWMKEIQAGRFSKVILRNVREFIMRQMNDINGFVPEGSTVDSFYLKYLSETKDAELELHFQYGQNFTDDEMVIPQVIKATGAGYGKFVLQDQVSTISRFYNGKVKVADEVMNLTGRKVQLIEI